MTEIDDDSIDLLLFKDHINDQVIQFRNDNPINVILKDPTIKRVNLKMI